MFINSWINNLNILKGKKCILLNLFFTEFPQFVVFLSMKEVWNIKKTQNKPTISMFSYKQQVKETFY